MDIDKMLGKIIGKKSSKGASNKNQSIWSSMSSKNRNILRKTLKDSDGDRVPNKFDCRPRNVMEQGKLHQGIFYTNKQGSFFNPQAIDHAKVWPKKIEQDYGQTNRWDEPVRLRVVNKDMVSISNIYNKGDFSMAIQHKPFYNSLVNSLILYKQQGGSSKDRVVAVNGDSLGIVNNFL